MLILAIDPGPSTGFALYETSPPQVILTGILVLPRDHEHQHLWEFLCGIPDFEVLIVERFEFRKDERGRAKIDYMASQLEGVCRLYAQLHHTRVKLVMQGANMIGKTAFWSDDNKKVKAVGLYNSKAAPHGMDALRHILYYVSFVLQHDHWLRMLR